MMRPRPHTDEDLWRDDLWPAGYWHRHRWWRHEADLATLNTRHVLGLEVVARRVGRFVRRELWRGWVRAGMDPSYYEAVVAPWRDMLLGPPDEAFVRPGWGERDLGTGEWADP